jgi:hypothetical protein
LLAPARIPVIVKAIQELRSRINVIKNGFSPVEKHQYEGLVESIDVCIDAALNRYNKM